MSVVDFRGPVTLPVGGTPYATDVSSMLAGAVKDPAAHDTPGSRHVSVCLAQVQDPREPL